MMKIGTPVAWKLTDRRGVVYMTIYAKVVAVRHDGRLVLKFPGKSGRAVRRIARAESVSIR